MGTDLKLETTVVETETELDFRTESIGKIIEYIIEMTVLKSNENQTLEYEEINEMTPLKTEVTDESDNIITDSEHLDFSPDCLYTGDTDQTDVKLETAVVEIISTAETEMDIPIE